VFGTSLQFLPLDFLTTTIITATNDAFFDPLIAMGGVHLILGASVFVATRPQGVPLSSNDIPNMDIFVGAPFV
jgi:hypothetical protein